MKKILLIALLLTSIFLYGCKDIKTLMTETNFKSEYVSLREISRGDNYKILVDENTKVLYLWYKDTASYGQTLTVLLNTDGTPKLLEVQDEN